MLTRAGVVGDREKQAETRGTWGVACSGWVSLHRDTGKDKF